MLTMLARQADVAIAGLVILIVGMMVIPLPPALLSLLIVTNVAVAIRYATRPLGRPHSAIRCGWNMPTTTAMSNTLAEIHALTRPGTM